MNQEMRVRFTDEVRTKAANLYDVSTAGLNLLGNHQSYVYGYEKGGNEYILRISHSSHRSVNQIEAELNWIEYLAENGVAVSRPVHSYAGSRIETLEINQDKFIVVAYNKAAGNPWSDAISQNEEFKLLGKLTGNMHSLTKRYEPLTTQPKRFLWYENDYLQAFTQNVPAASPLIVDNFQRLIKKIHLLPKCSESFGLIHGDFCFGNYSVKADGTITVFDFDECQYGWFVQDIAVNLFYGIAVPSDDEDATSFVQRYLTYFLEGYLEENTIDHRLLLKQLAIFLDLRQAVLYSSLHRNGHIENLDPWSKTFLERAEKNMLHERSFIDIEMLNL
ncbi:phosphotransferase enzyme family protein [Paenibacillus terrigena]|uniref:phosphotransferase enzyme family protein n=1 Tax=Paenibacillus terrigena TaxID=369333 RepID=UPI0003703AF3|nr:phosphotransferase [Paenibacillus terrigena]